MKIQEIDICHYYIDHNVLPQKTLVKIVFTSKNDWIFTRIIYYIKRLNGTLYLYVDHIL